MLRFVVLLPLFAAAACTRAEPPLLIDGGEQAQEAGSRSVAEAHKAAIRADVQRRHGPVCGTITLPDDAFVPIEMTDGGATDYAVLFQKATCPRNATNWQNTGGTLTQFWTVSGERPRLLLEQHTYGFTPTVGGFDSLQHQNDCGPDSTSLCVVSYRWDRGSQAMRVVQRRNQIALARMQWDYRNPQ